MNNVQERLPDTLAPGLGLNALSAQQMQNAPGGSPILGTASDAIRRLPGSDEPSGYASPTELFGGVVQQLLGIIRQLLSMLGWNSGGQSGDRYFQNATASSTGDPHVAFDGTAANGQNESAHFDSMEGHADFLNSESFAGGYRISTAVTQPGANGITYNRCATVTTNYGGTQLSLDNTGKATVCENGRTIALANGQTIAVGNGESITRNGDGSVTVPDNNGAGGSITTTLSENGSGVDVRVQAQNVELGGDALSQRQWPPYPVLRPFGAATMEP